MFFSIDHIFSQDFPCHWALGMFCVSTDQGWKQTRRLGIDLLYKGYADQDLLEPLLEQIISQGEPGLTGNFCVIAVCDGSLQIQTDRYRGFPIYIGQHNINNLVPQDHVVWTDQLITVDRDLDVIQTKFNLIGKIDTAELDFHEAQDQVHDILCQRTQQLLKHNTRPLKVFLSGGIDTMLIYSYLKAAGAEFELLNYEHFEHDYFWRNNSDKITDHWGYKQTHHWQHPCIIASGATGDEFTLRIPSTANLYLLYHNTSIPELLKFNRFYHNRNYFNLSKHIKVFDQQIKPNGTLQQLHYDLCNIIVNDWQHWHLGNTLHWTPLKDLEISKIIMRLPLIDIKNQIMDSTFSRSLIERNLPGANEFISDQKIAGPSAGPELKNLNALFGDSMGNLPKML
jgi:hypothetical protein